MCGFPAAAAAAGGVESMLAAMTPIVCLVDTAVVLILFFMEMFGVSMEIHGE